MNEPTQPTDEALFNALKDLIVEAQAVADDHHRPRYARLDQALASARNARLGYWATPQPTQAQAVAVPLTPDQIKALEQARSTAMHMTAAGRIPECGDFAAIAQNLDWLCNSFGIKEGAQHGAT